MLWFLTGADDSDTDQTDMGKTQKVSGKMRKSLFSYILKPKIYQCLQNVWKIGVSEN